MNTVSMLREISRINDVIENPIDRAYGDEWKSKVILEVPMRLRFIVNTFLYLERICKGAEMKVDIKDIDFSVNEENDEHSPFVKGLDDLGIPVDVTIGHLSMSLKELLAIEKGECIVSKIPANKTLTLMIAGETIAEAGFELEGDMIIFKINQTFLNDNEDRIDNSLELAKNL